MRSASGTHCELIPHFDEKNRRPAPTRDGLRLDRSYDGRLRLGVYSSYDAYARTPRCPLRTAKRRRVI